MARERTAPLPALAGSIALHGGLLIFAIFAWPWLNPPAKLPQVVAVTLVTETDQGSLKSAIAAPTPAPAATETPVPDASPQAPAPQPAPAPAPTPAPPKPAPIPPKPKPQSTPGKTAPAKPDQTLDLDALAASLNAQSKASAAKPSSAQKGPNRQQTAAKTQTSTGIGDVDASGALSSMTAELQRLWNPNCDAGGGTVIVTVTYRLGRSGRLLGAPTSSGDNASDPMIKTASDRAKRAVYQAEPFENLPPDLYDGQKITVNFDAKKACAQK